MSALTLETDNTQDISVMMVKGRIDSDTAPQFDSALSNLINDHQSKIVLNMHEVEFLSSAGLRAMVKALKGAQSFGGNLHLASVSQPIEVILRTVGMLQMFKMFSTSEEAVAGF